MSRRKSQDKDNGASALPLPRRLPFPDVDYPDAQSSPGRRLRGGWWARAPGGDAQGLCRAPCASQADRASEQGLDYLTLESDLLDQAVVNQVSELRQLHLLPLPVQGVEAQERDDDGQAEPQGETDGRAASGAARSGLSWS